MKTTKIFALAALLALAACKAPTTGTVSREIYPDPAQAKTDLASALQTAARSHKRILLEFGGNWCADCQVLNIYFHDAKNRPLLEANYVLVPINIGHMDANLDIAERYEVPLRRGVPALAVLSENGALLYSQKGGEFEAMRRMDPSVVTGFLVQWKPDGAPCSAAMVNC
jgi:thiol:disulfide interchange protein